jgi:hypothetical protein
LNIESPTLRRGIFFATDSQIFTDYLIWKFVLKYQCLVRFGQGLIIFIQIRNSIPNLYKISKDLFLNKNANPK